jgi:hypothetical protein
MNEKKINEMVNSLEMMKFFSGEKRFPKTFYNLTEEEQKEVVKRYRRRNGLDKPPNYETK